MGKELIEFGETAKGLAKNPLGIIALFIVLVYGFAALVTTFASSLSPGERLPLIWFLVLFPVMVLVIFAWLVSRHAGKLYNPSEYKNEDNFMRGAVDRLERNVLKFEATSSSRLLPLSRPGTFATPHRDSRLAVAQMRLDVERELLLLSRHSFHRADSAGWDVERHLQELEKAQVVDTNLATNLRDFVALANTIVHGAEVPEDDVQRSATVGSALVATLHRKRLVLEAERDFDGHGLWHMHQHLGQGDKKYYFWSAVAACLPEFDYEYDVYQEALEHHNAQLVNSEHPGRAIQVLSLEEFVSVLEFRESELLRIIDLWRGGHAWEKGDRAMEWKWPLAWGDVGWNGPILRERVHLWGAEEDLMRVRAALANLRPRRLTKRRADSP